MILLDQAQPIVADETEAATARTAAARLSAFAETGQGVQLAVREHPEVVVPLTGRAVALLVTVLNAMSEGRPFSIIPHDAELTTQQAADFLNVSRPFLIGLVDRGEIPHRRVGRHRRIRFTDVAAFERASLEKRSEALADLATEAERLRLD